MKRGIAITKRIVNRYLQNALYYVLFLIVLLCYVRMGLRISDGLYDANGPSFSDAIEKYGLLLTVFMSSLSIGIYISVPYSLINIIGLVILNPFTVKRNRQNISRESPFICFKVVTRGLYPKLVQHVTETNLQTCHKVGLKNFKFEIITDFQLNIQQSNYVREIVVPAEYRTPNGTLFKARALHYSLDDSVNILSGDDWVVHLDEETLLTKSVVYGIIEFITKKDAAIGQGVITYGGSGVENWITTLLDGVRTAIDYGAFRFAHQLLHRPIFGFKGSFIVVKMSVEQHVGFDFGPKESIAEDLRFALTAWTQGYKFDFVHGIMKEKSTFTLADYIKQRKRWFIGHFHVIWGNSLKWNLKMGVIPMHISNMLLWVNITYSILSLIFPLPLMKWQLDMFILVTANILFLLSFGNFMSIGKEYSLAFRLLMCLLSQLILPVLGVVEAYAVLLGLFHRNKLAFEIVQKETAKTGQRCDV